MAASSFIDRFVREHLDPRDLALFQQYSSRYREILGNCREFYDAFGEYVRFAAPDYYGMWVEQVEKVSEFVHFTDRPDPVEIRAANLWIREKIAEVDPEVWEMTILIEELRQYIPPTIGSRAILSAIFAAREQDIPLSNTFWISIQAGQYYEPTDKMAVDWFVGKRIMMDWMKWSYPVLHKAVTMSGLTIDHTNPCPYLRDLWQDFVYLRWYNDGARDIDIDKYKEDVQRYLADVDDGIVARFVESQE